MFRGRRYSIVGRLALTTALLAGHGEASGHELERTRVALTFAPDGTFLLEVANDPNWLLLRLESFVDGNVASGLDPVTRDARLRALTATFADRIVLFVDGHEVRPELVEYVPPRPQPPADGLTELATFRLRGRMPNDARTLRWLYGLVIDPYPLSITRSDGRLVTEWIRGTDWSGTIDLTGQFRQATRREVASRYLALGYTHILPKGLDHMLFVLGLFLLSVRVRPILVQVTTFTVAHSITLGLAMLGVVALPPRLVEPLIALSIAYVAIENLVTRELKPWRLGLVFAFGLLHGLGFAGVLADLGLPRGERLTALVSFNLGVEGGQLTVIALAALLVAWYRHHSWYHRRIVAPASLAIATVGVYWTIARAIDMGAGQ